MIEMEIVLRSAEYAFSLVSFPDVDLHSARDYSVIVDDSGWGGVSIFGVVRQLQLELEDSSLIRFFCPSIRQIKKTVVYPNSRPYFFKDFDSLRRGRTRFEAPYCVEKQTVLCWSPTRVELRLIDSFWIRSISCFCHVMAFINKDLPTLFNTVSIRRSSPKTHEN